MRGDTPSCWAAYPRKVFVDVGAHEGQTLEEVTRPAHGFDLIYAIEPMPATFQTLFDRYGHHLNVEFLPVALSIRTGTAVLYGTNELLEASLFPRKDDVDDTVRTEVRTLRASDFLASIPPARIFVKLNCEGAEAPILSDLIHSGAIGRITRLLIDWDIGKVPGMERTETMIRRGLDRRGYHWDTWPEGITHQRRLRAWLEDS